MSLRSLNAAEAPNTQNLQRSFGLAIFRLIMGPPETRVKAVKKIRDIVEFASMNDSLGDSEANN